MAEQTIHVAGDYGPEMYVYIDDLPDKQANLREAWVTAKDFRGLIARGGAGQLVSSMPGPAELVVSRKGCEADYPESVYVLTDHAEREKGEHKEKRWKVGLAVVAGEKERDCEGLPETLPPPGAPVVVVDFYQGFVEHCHGDLPRLVAGRPFAVRTHDPVRAVNKRDEKRTRSFAEMRRHSAAPSLWFCPRQDMADGSLRVPGAWQTQRHNLVQYLRDDTTLWDGGQWLHAVVVQIDNDGCLVLGPGPQAEGTLLVFPGEQPGSHARRMKDHVVVGGGIVILAALAECLREGRLEHSRLVRQAQVGLVRARRLMELGYREVEPDPPARTAAGAAIGMQHRHTHQSLFPLALLDRAVLEEEAYPQPYGPPPPTLQKAIELLGLDEPSFGRQIVFSLEKWLTCDQDFAEKLLLARDRIERHVKSDDKKVLNFAVFGGPGSGKSFMVEQIQAALGNSKLKTLKYNVSQFQSLDHLREALVEIQSESLRGNVPFVQWDEFDCFWERQKGGWLSRFLMPMQDAAFADGTLQRALDKCVFVFIGGTFADGAEFEQWMGGAAGQRLKGPDFHSRLDRVLDVPSVEVPPHPRRRAPPVRRPSVASPT